MDSVIVDIAVSQPVFVFVQTNRVGHVLSPNALSLVQRDGNRSGVWNTRLDDLPLSLDRDSGFSRTMFEFNLLVLQLLNAAFWLAWLVEAHGLIWLQRRNSARSRQLLLGFYVTESSKKPNNTADSIIMGSSTVICIGHQNGGSLPHKPLMPTCTGTNTKSPVFASR
jgi:hypothetical protein